MRIFYSINVKQTVLSMGLLSSAVSIQAAVPENVTQAISDAKNDGMEVGWLIIGVFAGLFVFGIIKGLMK